MDKLAYGSLIEVLKACSEYKEDFEVDEKQKNYLGNYQEDFEQHQSESKKDSEDEMNDEADQKEIELDEKQFIEIAQASFLVIAQYLKDNNHTINSYFGNSITQETIEGKLINVIPTGVFLEKVQGMGIEGFNELHQACITKVLHIPENKDLINIEDLSQILEDYKDEDHKMEESLSDKDIGSNMLNYDELDDISMIILLALTEYLVNKSLPLYDLFDNHISNIMSPNEPNKMLEFIAVANFFSVLKDIGIDMKDKGHENLQSFLSIDNHKDKISLDKLKASIHKFATDDKLRERAHEHYIQFLKELED